MAKLKRCEICTDEGSQTIMARTASAAVKQFTHGKILTPAAFKRNIERVGGYGWMECDGVRLFKVFS